MAVHSKTKQWTYTGHYISAEIQQKVGFFSFTENNSDENSDLGKKRGLFPKKYRTKPLLPAAVQCCAVLCIYHTDRNPTVSMQRETASEYSSSYMYMYDMYSCVSAHYSEICAVYKHAASIMISLNNTDEPVCSLHHSTSEIELLQRTNDLLDKSGVARVTSIDQLRLVAPVVLVRVYECMYGDIQIEEEFTGETHRLEIVSTAVIREIKRKLPYDCQRALNGVNGRKIVNGDLATVTAVVDSLCVLRQAYSWQHARCHKHGQAHVKRTEHRMRRRNYGSSKRRKSPISVDKAHPGNVNNAAAMHKASEKRNMFALRPKSAPSSRRSPSSNRPTCYSGAPNKPISFDHYQLYGYDTHTGRRMPISDIEELQTKRKEKMRSLGEYEEGRREKELRDMSSPESPTHPQRPSRRIEASMQKFVSKMRAIRTPSELEQSASTIPPRLLGAYHDMRPLDILITVEHCHDCESHPMTLRHVTKEYCDRANDVLRCMLTNVQSWHACARVGAMRILTDVSPPQFDTMQSSNSCRVGAFEIQIAYRSESGDLTVELLHSKLFTRRWPSKIALDKRMQLFFSRARLAVFSGNDIESYAGNIDDGWDELPLADPDWEFPAKTSEEISGVFWLFDNSAFIFVGREIEVCQWRLPHTLEHTKERYAFNALVHWAIRETPTTEAKLVVIPKYMDDEVECPISCCTNVVENASVNSVMPLEINQTSGLPTSLHAVLSYALDEQWPWRAVCDSDKVLTDADGGCEYFLCKESFYRQIHELVWVAIEARPGDDERVTMTDFSTMSEVDVQQAYAYSTLDWLFSSDVYVDGGLVNMSKLQGFRPPDAYTALYQPRGRVSYHNDENYGTVSHASIRHFETNLIVTVHVEIFCSDYQVQFHHLEASCICIGECKFDYTFGVVAHRTHKTVSVYLMFEVPVNMMDKLLSRIVKFSLGVDYTSCLVTIPGSSYFNDIPRQLRAVLNFAADLGWTFSAYHSDDRVVRNPDDTRDFFLTPLSFRQQIRHISLEAVKQRPGVTPNSVIDYSMDNEEVSVQESYSDIIMEWLCGADAYMVNGRADVSKLILESRPAGSYFHSSLNMYSYVCRYNESYYCMISGVSLRVEEARTRIVVSIMVCGDMSVGPVRNPNGSRLLIGDDLVPCCACVFKEQSEIFVAADVFFDILTSCKMHDNIYVLNVKYMYGDGYSTCQIPVPNSTVEAAISMPQCCAGHTLVLTRTGDEKTCNKCGSWDKYAVSHSWWVCRACSFSICGVCMEYVGDNMSAPTELERYNYFASILDSSHYCIVNSIVYYSVSGASQLRLSIVIYGGEMGDPCSSVLSVNSHLVKCSRYDLLSTARDVSTSRLIFDVNSVANEIFDSPVYFTFGESGYSTCEVLVPNSTRKISFSGPVCGKGHQMIVSAYDEDLYIAGYACCLCRHHKTGKRWFCQKCSSDVCFDCISVDDRWEAPSSLSLACRECHENIRRVHIPKILGSWSCDWPHHKGSECVDGSRFAYGCSSHLSCSYTVCTDCWNSELEASRRIKCDFKRILPNCQYRGVPLNCSAARFDDSYTVESVTVCTDSVCTRVVLRMSFPDVVIATLESSRIIVDKEEVLCKRVDAIRNGTESCDQVCVELYFEFSGETENCLHTDVVELDHRNGYSKCALPIKWG